MGYRRQIEAVLVRGRRFWQSTLGFALALSVLGLGTYFLDDTRLDAEPTLFLANRFIGEQPIVDGRHLPDGSPWNATGAVVIGDGATVRFRVSGAEPLTAISLQGDHNDEFVIEASDDENLYRPIWNALPVDEPGLRTRAIKLPKPVSATSLRILVRAADGHSSLSEVRVFSRVDPFATPSRFPPGPDRVKQIEEDVSFFFLVILVIALVGFGGPSTRRDLFLVIPLGIAAVRIIGSVPAAYPLAAQTLSFIRMWSALIGVAVLVRVVFSRFFRIEHKPNPITGTLRTGLTGVLIVSGVISCASFFNFGAPQFYDAERRRPDFVHNADMQIYFLQSRYARELRFDGLYDAVVAALVENDPAMSLEKLGSHSIRDLRDHRLRKVRDLHRRIENVHRRFSAERWRSFKNDAAHFQRVNGVDFTFQNLRDHGGNATPVWLMTARALFHGAPAGHSLLIMGAMADPVLLLLLFLVVARTFGWPQAALCMIVFGANDFYMGGTNWAGATLRHDWMVLLGLGFCAMKSNRLPLAGALLMWATLIRAFPGVVFVPLAGISVYWAVRDWLRHGPAFTWRQFRVTEGPILRIAVGALLSLGVFILIACLVYGPDIWLHWLSKVASLNSESHLNNVSLKAVFAASVQGSTEYGLRHGVPMDWQQAQQVVFSSRFPYFLLTATLATALILAAAIRSGFERCALMGLALIPIWLDPANYYHHVLFLLPLYPFGRKFSWSGRELVVALAAVLLCVCQYGTTWRTHLDDHYYDGSILLLATWGGITAAILLADQNGGYSFFTRGGKDRETKAEDRGQI